MNLSQRHKEAIQLREEGKAFKEIGIALSVSTERARQIYNKAKRLEALGPRWTDGLPTMQSLTLVHMGFTSKDEVALAIKGSKPLKANSVISGLPVGIGRKGIKIIKEWLKDNSTPSASPSAPDAQTRPPTG